MSLLEYQQDVYSQNGEDGILEELCRRLGLSAAWFCEFGAWDGVWLSNCRRLADAGWSGIFIEGDRRKYRRLMTNIREYDGRVYALQAFVATEGDACLDALLSRFEIPEEFGVLSIDIDSFDWHVWQSLHHYRPLIVVIEVNTSLPPQVYQIHAGGAQQGSSFAATLDLARAKGYTLVCHTGNMVFVRSDRVADVGLSAAALATPETLFNWQKHRMELTYQSELACAQRKLMTRARRSVKRALAGRRGT
jgi:hypothetical protein